MLLPGHIICCFYKKKAIFLFYLVLRFTSYYTKYIGYMNYHRGCDNAAELADDEGGDASLGKPS